MMVSKQTTLVAVDLPSLPPGTVVNNIDLRRGGEIIIGQVPARGRPAHNRALPLAGQGGTFLPRESLSDRGVAVVSLTWESCQMMPLVGGFSRRSPVSPALHSGAAPYSPHPTLIGSQDLDDKSPRPGCAEWGGGGEDKEGHEEDACKECKAEVATSDPSSSPLRNIIQHFRPATRSRGVFLVLVVRDCAYLGKKGRAPSPRYRGDEPPSCDRAHSGIRPQGSRDEHTEMMRERGGYFDVEMLVSYWLREALGTGIMFDWLLHVAKGSLLARLPACEFGTDYTLTYINAHALPGIGNPEPPAPQIGGVLTDSATGGGHGKNMIIATTRLPPRRTEFDSRLGRSRIFSDVRIVLDDPADRRAFSGNSRSPGHFIPVLFRTHFASPSSALKTSMLRAAQIFSLTQGSAGPTFERSRGLVNGSSGLLRRG
ncbi:hypothetical protein PR048_027722 [Dryococelus australis]|uniref:Uncharacterized protein n=1 Tax=Dryococelus australis TaxID=614101 RepID=A0ABQ9GHB5_9NEOP|nr:hypothetical protein PR048_027722 [Dryococelus australis]